MLLEDDDDEKNSFKEKLQFLHQKISFWQECHWIKRSSSTIKNVFYSLYQTLYQTQG